MVRARRFAVLRRRTLSGESARLDAMGRLGADATVFGLGLLSGIATARGLGVSGKGTLATLSFILSMAALIATLGLGDAVVVWANKQGQAVSRLMPRFMSALLIASLVAMVVCAGVSLATIGATSADTVLAIGFAVLGVPATAMWVLASSAAYALARYRTVNVGMVMTATAVVILTILLVNVLGLGLAGGIAALAAGQIFAAAFMLTHIRGLGVPLRPILDHGLLRAVVPFGARAQLSSSLTLLVGRADVLATYLLANGAAAGRYSVALTVAGVAGLAPFSLTAVMFPRAAAASDYDAPELIAQLTRLALACSITVAAIIAVVVPVAIPVLFGEAFAGSVPATEILLPGFIAASAQWALGRSALSRGHPSVLLGSWALNLVLMLGLDLVLIPDLGIIGGALASATGSAAGAVFTVWFQPGVPSGSRLSFVRRCAPGIADLRELARTARQLGLVRRSQPVTPSEMT